MNNKQTEHTFDNYKFKFDDDKIDEFMKEQGFKRGTDFIVQTDKLEQIFDLQKTLNKRVGVPEHSEDEKQTSEWTLKFSRALIHEVIELERELDWKHWKKSSINLENAKEEAIDCLHFLVSIFIQLGMAPDDVYYEYLKKNNINHERQENGY